jgi:hypothetical protein
MDVDASELAGLYAYLDTAEKEAPARTYPVVKQHAQELRDAWQKNARATAGRHGKHYPKSITAEQIPSASIEWEVGPEIGRKQGSMGRGFEFGSSNQPPHLDGMQAATVQEPKFLAALDAIAEGLL